MAQITRSYPACAKCLAKARESWERWREEDDLEPFDPEDWANEHPQAHIEWGDGDWRDAACVDEEVAPLILALWKLGLQTDGSCQDRNEFVCIDAFSESLLYVYHLLGAPRWMSVSTRLHHQNDDLQDNRLQNLILSSALSFPRECLPAVTRRFQRLAEA